MTTDNSNTPQGVTAAVTGHDEPPVAAAAENVTETATAPVPDPPPAVETAVETVPETNAETNATDGGADGIAELRGIVAAMGDTLNAVVEAVNKHAPDDDAPIKRPWTHWGSK